MRLVLPKRYATKMELYRDGGFSGISVEVAGFVEPSADLTEWEVGPIECEEELTPDEIETAKDALAELAQRAEMSG